MLGIADPLRFLIDLLSFFAIYLMLSISLNIEYGYTGIPNFGKVLFFAGGAFTVGSLTARLIAPLAGIDLSKIDYRINNVLVGSLVSMFFAKNPAYAIATFILMITLGTLIAALLGFIASYPAIRLKEDYLGITLLVAGELARIIAKNYDPLICGTLGVFVPNPFAWVSGRLQEILRMIVLLSFAAAVWLLTNRLLETPFGRALRALREDEIAAASLGKDVVRLRMTALVLGSAIAGLAGSLYAFYVGSVHADDYTPLRTFIVWVMVILGGSGNNAGAALGAFIYVLSERLVMQYKYYIPAPFDINYLSYVLFGSLLILLLLYKPEGILPEKPIRTIRAEEVEKIRGIIKRRRERRSSEGTQKFLYSPQERQ